MAGLPSFPKLEILSEQYLRGISRKRFQNRLKCKNSGCLSPHQPKTQTKITTILAKIIRIFYGCKDRIDKICVDDYLLLSRDMSSDDQPLGHLYHIHDSKRPP